MTGVQTCALPISYSTCMSSYLISSSPTIVLFPSLFSPLFILFSPSRRPLLFLPYLILSLPFSPHPLLSSSPSPSYPLHPFLPFPSLFFSSPSFSPFHSLPFSLFFPSPSLSLPLLHLSDDTETVHRSESFRKLPLHFQLRLQSIEADLRVRAGKDVMR